MSSPASSLLGAEPSHRILIAGPTAVGKSAVAMQVALELNGEIVSMDSMQVYRGLDIGTDKPSRIDRSAVPHHLIDVVEATEPFDAGSFVAMARAAEEGILARGKVAIFCGGTGLYFRALLEGLGKSPNSNPELRAALESTPMHELREELKVNDPVTFARIDLENPRRLVRAVEVIRLTGRPFSEQRSGWGKAPDAALQARFGLMREDEDLRRRIDDRVDRMFDRGLLDETRRLLRSGLSKNRTAMQAIGYRQVVEHLNGVRSFQETVALVKQRTWQLVRRQKTWFRRQMTLEWIQLKVGEGPERAASRIAEAWRKLGLPSSRNRASVPADK